MAIFFSYAFIVGISESEALGVVVGVLLFLLLLPIFLLIDITYVRVVLELVIVLFRISEIVRQGRGFPARPSFERAARDTDQTTNRPPEGPVEGG